MFKENWLGIRVKEETRELGFGDWGIRKLGVPKYPILLISKP